MSEFRILFKWETVKADVGEFRQDSDLLSVVKVVDAKGDVFVGVRVPFEPLYWDNYEPVAQGQLAGEKVDPILTPAGMAYAKRKLEEPFKSVPMTTSATNEDWLEQEKKLNPGKVAPASDNDEWVTTSAPPSETVATESEDWGTAPAFSGDEATPDKENWDEKTENWDDEENLKEE